MLRILGGGGEGEGLGCLAWLIGVVVLYLALPLATCGLLGHALIQQSALHVNQQTQLALLRKGGEAEARTSVVLGLGPCRRQANDMLCVLPIPGAWPLIAAPRQQGAKPYSSGGFPAKSIQMRRSAKYL